VGIVARMGRWMENEAQGFRRYNLADRADKMPIGREFPARVELFKRLDRLPAT
jgi:hypothetical protein